MTKIAVGLSGGIDSSTSATLLKAKGYDVVGVTMRLWNECEDTRSGSCCTPEDYINLKLIANDKGFEHYLYTLSGKFKEEVVDYYVDSFKRGETPQPCTVCNTSFKWNYMWEFAKKLGCERIATGHYARVVECMDKFILKTARDLSKDQTFFLWGLTSEQLAVTEFPVGDMTKPEVRDVAKDAGLPNWNKEESMDVCFIKDKNRDFLKRISPESFRIGDVLNSCGEIIGEHDGAGLYTVGQSKGFRLKNCNTKSYVISIDTATNVITVGSKDDLLTDIIVIRNPNWVLGQPPKTGWVRIRHNGTLYPCEVVGDSIKIIGEKIVKSNKGQTAVVYSDPDEEGARYVYGGGWIAC